MDATGQNSNISRITDFLYVGSKIRAADWAAVEQIDPDLVISMVGGKAYSKLEFHHSIEFLTLRAFDSFLTPIPMSKLLKGVTFALPVIQNQGKVLVYCMKGRRRSVTMAAAILIVCGYTSEQAIDLIKERRSIADPARWYVKRRISRFEKVWNRQKEKLNV